MIEQDLKPFADGITKEQFGLARAKGTKYQVKISTAVLMNTTL